MVTEKQNKLA